MKKLAICREVIDFEVIDFMLVGNKLGWIWYDEVGEGKYGDFISFDYPDVELTAEIVKQGMDILRAQIVDIIESAKNKDAFRLTFPLKDL